MDSFGFYMLLLILSHTLSGDAKARHTILRRGKRTLLRMMGTEMSEQEMAEAVMDAAKKDEVLYTSLCLSVKMMTVLSTPSDQKSPKHKQGLENCLGSPRNSCYRTSKKSREMRAQRGPTVQENELPFMVKLLVFYESPDGTVYMRQCGGSIIGQQWILTAAHCVTPTVDRRSTTYELRQWFAIAGVNKIKMSDLDRRNTIYSGKPETVYRHPKYKVTSKNQYVYDAALLKVPEVIKFSSSVTPVCLPGLFDNERLTTIRMDLIVPAWGSIEVSNKPVTLKKSSGKAMTPEECMKLTGKTITEDMFCSMDEAHTSSACPADSGGPVVLTNERGEVVQMGIMSFGGDDRKICSGTEPVVHTLLSSIQPWMETIMKKE